MVLPFSPSISKNGFVFISGQIHLKDGKLLEGTIEEQTHQIMKNLQALLEKEGVSFKDVVKTTIYTTDLSLYEKVNEVYISYFSENPPAREMVGVKELPLGATLEISMIAAK
ncbi:MAG: Rid family detoxifying hydrolase [Candidatus Levybacteria bacterium]|nr:Rid family detoxifying hydrolase [Candidatus Levybacteria bacterium]